MFHRVSSAAQTQTANVEKNVISKIELLFKQKNNLTGNPYNDKELLCKIRDQSVVLTKIVTHILNSFSREEEYVLTSTYSPICIELLDDGCYHYYLPERIPRKMNVDTKGNVPAITNKYDKNELFTSYHASVVDFNSNSPFVMQEQILVAFINYYDNDEFWIDADNLDFKPFIDACIKGVLVPDDNGKHVDLYTKSKAGKPHTEVYAGREEVVLTHIIKALR